MRPGNLNKVFSNIPQAARKVALNNWKKQINSKVNKLANEARAIAMEGSQPLFTRKAGRLGEKAFLGAKRRFLKSLLDAAKPEMEADRKEWLRNELKLVTDRLVAVDISLASDQPVNKNINPYGSGLFSS